MYGENNIILCEMLVKIGLNWIKLKKNEDGNSFLKKAI